jgi:hypothetical protein
MPVSFNTQSGVPQAPPAPMPVETPVFGAEMRMLWAVPSSGGSPILEYELEVRRAPVHLVAAQ